MKQIQEIKDALAQGGLDDQLALLYCRAGAELLPYRARLERVMDGFAATFHADPAAQVGIFSAPGRTELGGNHTDHQQGKVLTGSVDLDAVACAAPNGTALVNIYSEGYGMTTIDCRDLAPVKSEENTTRAIIRGTLAKIAENGYQVAGFDAYVTSDVPGGSGLSSSACFEVLVGVMVNGLFCGGEIPMAELARIGQYAENVYFGKPSGLLDQMGCALGGIVAIDFADKTHPVLHGVQFSLADAGYAMCIIDTGADHSDLTADYAAVPAEMKAAAAVLGKTVLSEVDEAEFCANIPAIRQQCGDRAVLRGIHYYRDCKRVDQQVAALERGDFAAYLKLVKASGASSFQHLQNIATYRDPADQPVALAIAVAEGLLGEQGAVRVHGGGFAGTIQAYVPLELVDEFSRAMDAVLHEGACRVTYIRPVGGYQIV